MYCPKCGKENAEGAQLCSSCSWVLSSTSAAPSPPDAKTSGTALAAFILGIFSFLCFITAIPAIICGIIGLVKISKSGGQLKGKVFAILGIIAPFVIGIMMAVLMFSLDKIHQMAYQTLCATNLNGLGKSMVCYSNDYNDMYPTPSNWCDLLVMYSDVNPFQFMCKSSDTRKGESSYAINKNIANRKRSEIPPDVVILFETDFGKDALGRQSDVNDRDSHEFFNEQFDYTKIYRSKWNQTGGPEILVTTHHEDKGCNVLFNDGRVEFVKAKDISNLKWTADAARPASSKIGGPINAAKWSEGKAMMGTIATAIRAYAAEKGPNGKLPTGITELGFTNSDLQGNYFQSSDFSINVTSLEPLTFTITCAPTGANAPAEPKTVTLNQAGVWTP